ncbi:MAG: methyltransferase domain-containing protein [Rhodobacteraceae bacterium]|nr:methyltransferase domain-containing protein [Paracoccaceae bacterium]
MGVDIELFQQLADLSTRFQPGGRTLMLGRHSFAVAERIAWKFDRALSDIGSDLTHADLTQEDGYCETMMRKLGFGEMEAMDFSDYEGASIIHDLNRRIPSELEGQFDFIFDGGTIEHVFNVPVALENVFRMLKPGGRFVSANGFNGWPAHGIYQFNPELVWTFWSRNCGCEVHSCMGIHKRPRGGKYRINFRDPAITGKRLRLKGKVPSGRIYLYYEVERTPGAEIKNVVLQSDYETKWQDHNNAGETRLDAKVDA